MFVNRSNNIFPGLAQKAGVKTPYRAKAGRAGTLPGMQKSSAKTRQYMRDASKALKRLQDAVKCAKEAPVFMGPQSSDTFSVELSYTGSKFDSFDAVTMNVEQAATARQNLGFAQNVEGSDYAAGTHTFALEVNGKSHELQIEVAAGESNAAVQQKMADAINAAGLGVEAGISLHNDVTGRLATLSLTTKGMGDDAASFSVRDVSGTLVHTSGIGRVAREAQNARYTLNGVAHESTSNIVDVGNGVTATIRGASRGDFTITDGFYEVNARNIMSILYTPLNDLQTIAAEMKKQTGDDILALKVAGLRNQFEAVFSAFGVYTETSGLFNINPAKAGAALADGSLRGFLQDFHQNGGGIIGYLEAVAAGGLEGLLNLEL